MTKKKAGTFYYALWQRRRENEEGKLKAVRKNTWWLGKDSKEMLQWEQRNPSNGLELSLNIVELWEIQVGCVISPAWQWSDISMSSATTGDVNQWHSQSAGFDQQIPAGWPGWFEIRGHLWSFWAEVHRGCYKALTLFNIFLHYLEINIKLQLT